MTRARMPDYHGATCSVPACDVGATRRGWCDRHYRRWLNHGDTSVVLNGNFAGEAVEYIGAHHRVREAKGYARSQTCATCLDRADAWAYDCSDPDEIWGLYKSRRAVWSSKPEHYMPLCNQCHKAFDYNQRLRRAA